MASFGNLITPEARISCPALFEPKPALDGNLKYSCCLVFEPEIDLQPLHEAAKQVARDRWGARADELLRRDEIRLPFRHDGVGKGYDEGAVYINVSCKYRPSLFDANDHEINDPQALYAGCVVEAALAPFAYDRSEKGVSFGLRGIRKLRDGERFGRPTAAALFGDRDAYVGMTSPADNSDLLN